MNEPTLPFFFQPHWLVLAFVVFWFTSAAVMARIAGWHALAAAYPDRDGAEGQTLRFVSGALGSTHFPIRYRNCLRLRIGPQGLGVALMFPFKFRSPSFCVPWDAVEKPEESQLITTRTVHFRFRGQDRLLTLKGPIGQHVLNAYLAARPVTTD